MVRLVQAAQHERRGEGLVASNGRHFGEQGVVEFRRKPAHEHDVAHVVEPASARAARALQAVSIWTGGRGKWGVEEV